MNNDIPQGERVLATHYTTADTCFSDHRVSIVPQLIDVFDLARAFHVHHRTAQRWTKHGKIPYYRIGKSVRYSLEEVLNAALCIHQ